MHKDIGAWFAAIQNTVIFMLLENTGMNQRATVEEEMILRCV